MSPGDKVICIDDAKTNPRIDLDYQHWVKEGEIYTIRKIYPPSVGSGVLLEEIVNPPIYIKMLHGKVEPAFSQVRFRKLTKQELALTESIEETQELESVI
jgi:hypothetical protein